MVGNTDAESRKLSDFLPVLWSWSVRLIGIDLLIIEIKTYIFSAERSLKS